MYMTPEEYDNMLLNQKGVCAICKKNESGDKGKRLSVDYNNRTGKVRGLLCGSCNIAIGEFEDDFIKLQNAIIYLIRNEEISWDMYFINIAALVSTRSKDPSTQVGAVIVKDNVIISTGYNGFPRGCNDSISERYNRPLKYDWTVHSEENAILNASRYGMSTLNSTLYVTPMRPCYKCTRAIIQSGIKRVVCQNLMTNDKWDKEFEISKQMLEEAKIDYTEL